LEEAVADLMLAREVKWPNWQVPYLLGFVHYIRNDYAAAIDEYSRCARAAHETRNEPACYAWA
jgi:hypothetical protein